MIGTVLQHWTITCLHTQKHKDNIYIYIIIGVWIFSWIDFFMSTLHWYSLFRWWWIVCQRLISSLHCAWSSMPWGMATCGPSWIVTTRPLWPRWCVSHSLVASASPASQASSPSSSWQRWVQRSCDVTTFTSLCPSAWLPHPLWRASQRLNENCMQSWMIWTSFTAFWKWSRSWAHSCACPVRRWGVLHVTCCCTTTNTRSTPSTSSAFLSKHQKYAMSSAPSAQSCGAWRWPVKLQGLRMFMSHRCIACVPRSPSSTCRLNARVFAPARGTTLRAWKMGLNYHLSATQGDSTAWCSVKKVLW